MSDNIIFSDVQLYISVNTSQNAFYDPFMVLIFLSFRLWGDVQYNQDTS